MSEVEQIARYHYETTRKENPDRPAWNRLNPKDLHHMLWKQAAFREAHRIMRTRRTKFSGQRRIL